MDKPEISEYLDEKGWNIHAKGKKLYSNIGIIGVGYSAPTPFNTPSEASEDTILAWLYKAYKEVNDFEKLIMVSHTPPFGTQTDKISSGANVGSKNVYEFIKHVQPDICITGHIHESKGVDFIGKTKVLNPGAFGSGGYVIIELDGDKLDAEIITV
ncbi:MAG: hypothetical protein HQK78_14420 [Desulfobacterales bacterium]|nr:hypothetical protein [Desulfobacterales bacterium]